MSLTDRVRKAAGVFAYTGRAISLVWATNKVLFVALLALTIAGGLIPAGVAWVGKEIIDAVLLAIDTRTVEDRNTALMWVGVELALVTARQGARRGLDVANSLLRAQLGHKVNVMILEKAVQLELTHFEDSSFYDKLTRARREASSRPLGLVRKSFGVIQNAISLVSYAAILFTFSGWAVVLLALASIPAFIAETKFAGQAFRLFRWRSPETRKQMYLETVLAREDFAKEVKLLQLGPLLLKRYRDIFTQLYGEDRNLTLRRGFWGYTLGLVSTAALYGAYAWAALRTMSGDITLGDMTLVLLVFKQGQAAFTAILSAIGGMYEDNLYLSNLYEYLEQPTEQLQGTLTQGPAPGDGVRFEGVEFTYPGAETPALHGLDLHVQPGRKLALVGHNGSGKTTLIKLLTRLYEPQKGRILLDGAPLQEWEPQALRRRVGVIFQDFVRYQFQVGENIGVGDVPRIDDAERQADAAQKGMAAPFIDELPQGYETQLGRWFKDGRELSIGQWQKVALSRAFMRSDADILVLDEPTAAMDAEAESLIFERLVALTQDQLAILISHRFSTVRMADEIVVLEKGRLIERGTHEQLMEEAGEYARLFTLQAQGYT